MSIGAGGLGNLPGGENAESTPRRFLVKLDRRSWKVTLRAHAMKAFPYDKSPAETPTIEIDCSDELGDGETIETPTLVVSVIATRGAADATPDAMRNGEPTLNAAKTSVLQKIRDGIDGVTYKFKLTCSTSAGRTFEGAASLRVTAL